MGLFFFLFIFFYAVTWIVFSFVYWLNAKFRGDLDYYWALDELDRVRSAMSTCRVDINSTSCPFDHFVKIGESVGIKILSERKHRRQNNR